MSLQKTDNPALILIDIQKGFENIEYWGGQRNNPDAEENASELLKLWRENNLPIFHIKHCSLHPTSLLNEANAGNEFKEFVKPIGSETVIKNNVPQNVRSTRLLAKLDLHFEKRN